MCAETACLALRLEGPLQSWGTSSQYNRRRTDLLPSRSAITGMLCAALGLDRGSSGESTFLREMAAVHMLAVAVPRCAGESVLSVQRLEDYHTVQHTAKADGKLKDCHITRRQYLLNASFRVFLSGDRSLLEKAGAALQDPVWGIWLGRKACLPTAPVFAGIYADEQAAVRAFVPEGMEGCAFSRDAASFAEGTDSVADMPLCFASSARSFTLRRIRWESGE
ncbi:type I-E CRISPR-associated protein Cas5/CasD [uncultured Desulfovibrio sp.]|uniref:type I-E CRISPR-associated protein Cas5/CasD n=1 Tax=uncultured Desulfovibrio sp. TaxID=167968 RepID=UPI0026365CC0|nr:type I-E CRISPR-associated protein Cas5/CasD [uncultured Desulfovibrio sp.]